MDWQEKFWTGPGMTPRGCCRSRGRTFYLAAAALALRLGHRIPGPGPVLSWLPFSPGRQAGAEGKTGALRALGILEEKTEPVTSASTKPGQPFYYPYKLLFPPAVWNGLKIASMKT